MRHSRSTRVAAITALTGGLAAAMLAPASAAQAPSSTNGPSTDVAPYVVPVASGVSITSLLSDGDTIGGYGMGAIPDGLGATAGDGGTVTLLMNHEYNNGTGPEDGSYVSKWSLNPKTGEVLSGQTLFGGAGFSRFCSGTLSDPGIFTGKKTGYAGQIYFANEEAGDNGRTYGVTVDGTSLQLSRLGLASIENTVPAKTKGEATVIVSNEDSFDGQIRVYVGSKQATGSDFDKAGLTNGALHVMSVAGAATDEDFRAAYGKGSPAAVTFEQIDWNASGADQNAEAKANGISLNRIEDGHFDPRKPNDYYFLTTDGGEGTGNEGGGGGLWRLSFVDVSDPSKGATLTLLLDGTESISLQKPDNMTIDNGGNILIQEDPGNAAVVAKIAAYRIADGRTGVVAQFDPEQFTPGAANYLTQDEESSGIIDVSSLWKKPNTFLFDAQVHSGTNNPTEKGQLLVMTIQSWGQVYGG